VVFAQFVPERVAENLTCLGASDAQVGFHWRYNGRYFIWAPRRILAHQKWRYDAL
jgi:hypothetical protein